MVYDETIACIEAYIDEGVFPGASFSFVKQGNTYSYILGNAQVKPTVEKMCAGMLFDVASLTKVICTTTVILKLCETGKLSIDRSLKSYYPVFIDPKITLRHLLTHTSDIQTYIHHRDQLNACELKQAYLSLQSGENLGKSVVYTDAGTILLGFMLEHLYQKSATTIFEEEVLQPLAMKDSCFFPEDLSRVVPTEMNKKRGLIRGTVHDPKAYVLKEHAGNAGLFTTLADVQKFVKMYLTFGQVNGKHFLHRETIEELLSDHTPSKTLGRSIGWDLKTGPAGQTLLFHTGYTGTFLLMDLENQEAFIFLSNRVHPVDHRESYLKKRDQLIQIYLQ